MRVSVLQSGFIVFILFFGVSLIETLQAEDWLKAAFWLAIGISFLMFDGRTKGGTYN